MAPKSDTIEEIMRLNPTASPDFLAGFSREELARYLERLADASTGRGVPKGDGLADLRPALPVESMVAGSTL
jgi:hypothetical protein